MWSARRCWPSSNGLQIMGKSETSRSSEIEATDNLFEFKDYQTRFIGCFVPGREFLLAHGLTKKSDLHRKSDLEKAEQILADHIRRMA